RWRRCGGGSRCRRSSRQSSGTPSKVSDEGGGLVGRDLVAGQALEDLVAARAGSRLGVRVGIGRSLAIPGSEAEGPDEGLDPGADRRVGDPELALHVPEVPPRAEEALEE